MNKPLFKRAVACLILAQCITRAFAGDVPPQLEVAYTKAVVSFNSSRFDEALATLDSILEKAPRAYTALELKALILKAKGADKELLSHYANLIRVGPPDRKAKYYYEAAQLLYGAKRFSHARPYFEAAIRGKFNVGASHYFLGLIDFQEKKFGSAENHFLETVSSDARDLKPVAHFYLGVIHQQEGYALGAIRGMRQARALSEPWRRSNDPSLKKAGDEIFENTRKILKSLDRSRWFGNFSLVVQYDSNATVLPSAVTTGSQLESKQTIKQILTGGVGVMTSPVSLFQGVFSYRVFANFNDNRDAKSFDFLTHLPAANVMYKPYLKLFPGFRVEGNYTFQNQAGREEEFQYHQYNVSGDLGPFAHYEITSRLNAEFWAAWKPKKYFTDPKTGDERRSGDGFKFRLQGEYSSPIKYLEPSLTASFESDVAEGRNWKSTSWAFGFANTARMDKKNTITFGVDLSFTHFNERRPQRDDRFLQLRALWAHRLTERFSLLTDFTYANNASTVTRVFAYNRFYTGMGLNYAF